VDDVPVLTAVKPGWLGATGWAGWPRLRAGGIGRDGGTRCL